MCRDSHTISILCITQTGEVWDELVKELEQEGLEPVPFDQKLLEEVTHITEAKAEQVLETQVRKYMPIQYIYYH